MTSVSSRPGPALVIAALVLAGCLSDAMCRPPGGAVWDYAVVPVPGPGVGDLRTADLLEGIAPVAAAASGLLAGIAGLGYALNRPYALYPPWYGLPPNYGPGLAPGFGGYAPAFGYSPYAPLFPYADYFK